MSPDFTIITHTLELKLIPLSEANRFAEGIRHSSSLHQWLDWSHPTFSEFEAQDFLAGTRLNWVKAQAYGFGVYCRKNGELLGMVALNEFSPTFNMANIGYWVFDRYQQQGYALQAVKAIIEFAFSQLALTRLEIICDIDNIVSQRFAAKCGACFEVTAKNRFVFNGKPKDGKVYSITPESLS